MAKEAFGKEHGAQRMAGFWFKPEDLNIATDPKDPLYDSRAMEKIDDDFVKTIVDGGIIQPVSIMKRDDKAWVVTGRRRTLGARLANKILDEMGLPHVKVPCTYKRATDERLMRDIVVENEHRKQPNLIQKAEMAQRLLDMGQGISDIAPYFGVSVQTVNNWLNLLELPKEERDKIARGEESANSVVKKKKASLGKKSSFIRGKRDIRTMILSHDGVKSEYNHGFVSALRWVLGEDDG